MEPGSGKQSVYTHFPKNPNCDTCLKTKITRASCRRRAVPRAEHYGDLIIADHKILSAESESRNKSSIRRCGTRFGNTVFAMQPVQNKNFSGEPEEEANSHLQ